MALLGLDNFTNAVVNAGPAALADLAIVEDEIQEVVETITKQLALLKVDKFEADGHIPRSSFGGGERVAWVSTNYSGAHRATVETLQNTRDRLMEFQAACQDTRQLLTDIDQSSATEMKKHALALDALRNSTSGYWGEDN
ncbi:hypothetical protein HNR19_003349 [Nocardioides thalensis]|uniref:Uncharacterized protein n=1 Tax=Nocardioides thalensis TaxID=1914755 RepID=A0A853C674_9ACTN|nr:hypothetical protein [Nocardioides thalensis]NYJ02651.1 hypothetical protein [Nocardioides thalensis]